MFGEEKHKTIGYVASECGKLAQRECKRRCDIIAHFDH